MANYDDDERLETIDDDDDYYDEMDFKDDDSLGDDMEVSLKFNLFYRSIYIFNLILRISKMMKMILTTKWELMDFKILKQVLKAF